MSFRTVIPSNFEAYLDELYSSSSDSAIEARNSDQRGRELRLEKFPYAIVLQVSYPERDFANRWCWQQFGPARGSCEQSSSEYPACAVKDQHFHEGKWITHWLAKTSYDFGFNEWYFAQKADLDQFLAFLPHLNWGENYPR